MKNYFKRIFFRKKNAPAAPGFNGNPMALDSYGSRLDEAKEFNRPVSLYEHPLFAFIFTAFFILVDYICLSISWDTVQNQGANNVAFMAIACAMILDFPLAYAGYALKRFSQGLASLQIALVAVISALALFLTAYVYQYDFRMATQSMTFSLVSSEDYAEDNTESFVDEEEAEALTEEEQGVLDSAARFAGVLPLLTSGASFLFSYCTSNPLAAEIYKYKKAIIRKEARQIELVQLFEALEGDERRIDLFICDDRPYLERKLAYAEAETLNNMVSSRRLQMMIACGNSHDGLDEIEKLEEACALIESARQIVERHDAICSRLNEEEGVEDKIQPIIMPACFSSLDSSKLA